METKLQIHRDVYTEQHKIYKEQIQSGKAKIYTTKTDLCAHNNNALFKITDDLMKRTDVPKLPIPVIGIAQLADDFLQHFTHKDIRS